MATDADILADAKEAFKEAEEAEAESRRLALDDLRFARLAEQWPADIMSQRQRDGRPCLTINRLPTFIRQVVNDARQNKPSIKVRPADSSADVETAEVINGLIRNIEYTSNADVAYDTATDNAVTMGFGYIRITTRYAYHDTFDLDLAIERVSNPFSVYGDPMSQAADSSDWRTAFVVDTLRRKDFERQYKDAAPVDWEGPSWSEFKGSTWLPEDRVMLAEWWTREEYTKRVLLLSDGTVIAEDALEKDPQIAAALGMGGLQVTRERDARCWKVKQRILNANEVLEDNDWPGQWIPIVPVYGDEVDVEGKRYFRSLIRDAKDPQRMLNYWRTTATELVALAPRAPFIGPKGMFDTDPRWLTANRQNHPFLEYDVVPQQAGAVPQRQPLDSGPAAGALQEALNASDDMKSIMGMYDASLGAKSNETSGRAILARQREGDVSTFHFLDNMSRAIRHVGRIVIDLIPHVYSGERIVRVLGESGGDEKNVPVNQEFEDKDEAGVPITRIHDLAKGKYDLTVTTGPSFTTRREEAAAQMTELIRAFPAAAPLLGGLLAKNLDWPEADEVEKRLDSLLPPGLQKPAPGQPAPEELAALAMSAQQEAADKERQEKLAADIKAEEIRAASQIEAARIKAEADMMIAREKIAADQAAATEKLTVDRQYRDMDVADRRQAMASKAKEPPAAAVQVKHDTQAIVEPIAQALGSALERIAATNQETTAQFAATVAQAMAAPKRVVRDDSGRVVGVETA